MRLAIDEIKKTLEDIIVSKGVYSIEDAKILANDYLEGELNGKKSHGIAAFVSVISELSKKVDQPSIIKESSSAIYIDANKGFGSIVGRKITISLIDKANQQGIAVAYIRNMKSWLRPATIAQYVADHGLVAFVTNTGGPPMVAPPGGFDPVVGTNPIGLGIPAEDGSIVADMATSKRAWGEVRLAKRYNKELPKESYYAKDGSYAVNPDDAHSALPMGDYKGFALGLFIEIMGGSFVDMDMGVGEVDEPYYIRTRGANILIFDPNFTVGAEKFKSQNKKFVDMIHKTTALTGQDHPTIPGDRARNTRDLNLSNGYVEIDDQLWQEITSLF